MKKLFLTIAVTLISFSVRAAYPPSIKSTDLISGKPTELHTQVSDSKGSVIVFMSAKCPCSNSHVALLKKLSEKFKDYRFTAVHSNADESVADAQKYFKKAGLAFNVLQDSDSKIADLFQAFKTPHAFVLNAQGEVLYQGGVTNSSHGESADENFLDEVMSDLAAGKKPRMTEGRTLGCVILRKNELVK